MTAMGWAWSLGHPSDDAEPMLRCMTAGWFAAQLLRTRRL